MYLEWAGAGKSVIPSIDGYQAYMESVSKFMTNDRAKELFTDHVKHVVTRTNTVTGRKYKDDSAIFSWQIGNEPRCFSDDKDVQQAFVDFMWSTASLIKSLDPNHMVSSGSEGKWGCEGSMELFEKIHSCPDIDYMNIHVWPYNWNWVRETTLSANLGQALENTDAYIDEHLKVAEKYGKPVVLEEFGFPRDDFKFTQGTPTTARDTYYKHVFGRQEQTDLLAVMDKLKVIPAKSQVVQIKKHSKDGTLTVKVMEKLLSAEHSAHAQVVFKQARLHQYFPQSYTVQQMEEVIVSLLETWRVQNT